MIISNWPATGNPHSGALLDVALAWAARDWSVIPTRLDKSSACRWLEFQTRRATADELRDLFARPEVTGLAVITGSVSGGLAIRDFDREDAYERWANANPDHAARQPTVRTARGYHVYGRLDAEVYRTLDDGELRADSRHYVLLPPSLHPNGTFYAWTIPLEGPLPELPLSLTTDPDARILNSPSTSKQTQHNQPPIAWWTSAVAGTLPCGPGQRNRCIFDLARQLKAIRSDATAAELRLVLKEWHRLALPFIRTKDFSESWTDFVVAWERIRWPSGESGHSLAAAKAAAEAESLPPIVDQLGYDGNLRRLAALCWQLARQWGDAPFPLGWAIAGECLGISTRHAGRLLKALQFDGVIDLVTKGSKRTRKASEYRFITERRNGA